MEYLDLILLFMPVLVLGAVLGGLCVWKYLHDSGRLRGGK